MLQLRPLATASALAVTAVLSACATGPEPVSSVAVFDAAAFSWSTVPGNASVSGRIAYAGGGRSWTCAGSVGLTPETPWTRQRFQTLYGSTERAAIPAAIVRARSVTEASADYQGFVRSETCDGGGRFRFAGLPAGSWFLIAPVTSQGSEPVVLMRRVTTRGGQMTDVTLD
ncbi:MAG: hypothetical protein J0L52_00985 [Caulobacterales bacterium]|nr:hypothetical protein [Caulobacterales bacterium]